MSIITQLFPYQNIFPYIDISSIKVKKHRKMAPVMKRRKKIFYKENIDQDGFVFFEKSQPTYTIELRDYDNARIKKIHPYEFFCHGENNCFRDPVFEEYYDPNSGLIIKLLKHFQYINIGDKIQRIEIPIFQYIKIDENSILQKKVNFNDIVIESEDSAVHKAKIPITSEYELENILVKNGDNIALVRHKKNMQQEEIESEGGTIRKINVEVNKPKYYYRIISNNEDSVSLEKIPIPYKTKNFDGVNVKIEVGSYFSTNSVDIYTLKESDLNNGIPIYVWISAYQITPQLESYYYYDNFVKMGTPRPEALNQNINVNTTINMDGRDLALLINYGGTLYFQNVANTSMMAVSGTSLNDVVVPPENGYGNINLSVKPNRLYLIKINDGNNAYYGKIYVRSVNGTSSITADYCRQTAADILSY